MCLAGIVLATLLVKTHKRRKVVLIIYRVIEKVKPF
jgi:hypothetical protein